MTETAHSKAVTALVHIRDSIKEGNLVELRLVQNENLLLLIDGIEGGAVQVVGEKEVGILLRTLGNLCVLGDKS